MIKDNFKIDFENKIIYCKGKECDAKDLYSFLQDVFDEPENMKYDIPIVAKSKTEFSLINGWTFDAESLKHLKGGAITTDAYFAGYS